MLRPVIALDYFLYDNRTWSERWGRDWGLKAATGALAGRSDLKSLFDRYCGLLPSAQGQLRDFGEAIGGVRSPDRKGYLVCVTLECSDSFGRPSWAVVGLWCPDPGTLVDLLRGDPVQVVRYLLGGQTLPERVEVPRAKTALPKPLRRTTTTPSFHRFEGRATIQEVKALLFGAAGKGTLPNVLGITATSRFSAVQNEGFDVTYCQPMNDQAERALNRVVSPQVTVEEDVPPPANAEPRSSGPSEPRFAVTSPWEQGWNPFFFLLGGVVVALLLVTGLVLWSDSFPEEIVPTLDRGGADLDVDSGKDGQDLRTFSEEALLKKVKESLLDFQSLEPDELRGSESFQAVATLDVLLKFEEERSRAVQAFENLIDIRRRVVNRQGSSVAYYFEEQGKGTEPARKIEEIAEILSQVPLGRDDCEFLRKAFRFEFENTSSIVNRWCTALAKLDETVALLPLARPEDRARN